MTSTVSAPARTLARAAESHSAFPWKTSVDQRAVDNAQSVPSLATPDPPIPGSVVQPRCQCWHTAGDLVLLLSAMGNRRLTRRYMSREEAFTPSSTIVLLSDLVSSVIIIFGDRRQVANVKGCVLRGYPYTVLQICASI